MQERIDDAERLARFVFRRDHVRADSTVKPDAFIPHPHADCSVTRHTGISELGLWDRGEAVGAMRNLPLRGRADVTALAVRGAGLEPETAPREGNPQHANIVGWPAGKPNQKHQAQLLAKAAAYAAWPVG